MRKACVLVLVAACGSGGGATGDAGPLIDATTIDALRCSLPAPAAGSYPGEFPTPLFEIETGLHTAPSAVFATSDHLVLATDDAITTTALDGSGLVTTPLALPGATHVYLQAITAGVDDFGALLDVDGTYQLCVLDSTGALDASHCSVTGAPYGHPLVFDGTGFDLYVAQNGVLERRTYDTAATLIATATLPTEWQTYAVEAAARTPTSEDLVTTDWSGGTGCARLREHVLQPDGSYTTFDLVPDDATGVGVLASGSDGSGAMSIVYDASCRTDGCASAPEATVMLRTVGSATTIDAMPIGLSSWSTPIVFRDGDRTVTIGVWITCDPAGGSCMKCGGSGELSRYGADGTLEVDRAAVGATAGFSEYLVVAGNVIAPGDYVIAYDDGYDLHLSRVQLP